MLLRFLISSPSARDLLEVLTEARGAQPQLFKCSPDVLLFLLLPLFLSGHGLSLIVHGSDEPQHVLQWGVRVEPRVLIFVWRFSVQLSVEASLFFDVHCTVQERTECLH